MLTEQQTQYILCYCKLGGDDDEHCLFAVLASTGVVTVNDNAALDYEAADDTNNVYNYCID